MMFSRLRHCGCLHLATLFEIICAQRSEPKARSEPNLNRSIFAQEACRQNQRERISDAGT